MRRVDFTSLLVFVLFCNEIASDTVVEGIIKDSKDVEAKPAVVRLKLSGGELLSSADVKPVDVSESEIYETLDNRKLPGTHKAAMISDAIGEHGELHNIGDIEIIDSTKTDELEPLSSVIDTSVVDDEIYNGDQNGLPADKVEFEPIRMPLEFESYDYNKDGHIDINELVYVTGATENVQEAFAASDSNNDGKIDQEEFQSAPWDLSGQVAEDT